MKSFYSSSVGKKVTMALSGLALTGFVFGHMLGNLKAFQGREALDGYAEFLRHIGYPLVPEHSILWGVRLILAGAVTVHMAAAFQLWQRTRSARSTGYHERESQVFSYASRTMRWGGVIVIAFVAYHLLHLTIGSVHPDFQSGSVYDNLVVGFQSPLVVGVYLLAVGSLSLHLHHGIWSVFATLGSENPRTERLRRPLATGLALALFTGYAVVPLAVLVGLLER